jgi:AmmeMemoRadiSam system protein B
MVMFPSKGMTLIEKLDHEGFTSYLRKTGNTICGRHPIGVFLGTVAAMRAKANGYAVALNFVNYDQSNQCKNMRDSSVSYASAVFTMG